MKIQVGCLAGVYLQQPMAQVLLMADVRNRQSRAVLVLSSEFNRQFNFKRLQNALKRLHVGSSN